MKAILTLLAILASVAAGLSGPQVQTTSTPTAIPLPTASVTQPTAIALPAGQAPVSTAIPLPTPMAASPTAIPLPQVTPQP